MRNDFHTALVPSLDALIGDPSILTPEKDTKLKAQELILPMQYAHRVRDFRNEMSSRGEASLQLLSSFSNILEEIHYGELEYFTCENGMRIRFIGDDKIKIRHNESSKSSTENALAVAKYYAKNVNKDVAILTGDDYMMTLALGDGIDVARVSPEIYTGRRKIRMTDEACELWAAKGYLSESEFKKFFPNEKPLLLNEFVEFIFSDELFASYCTNKKNNFEFRIGRFEPYIDPETHEHPLQQLHYVSGLPKHLRPRTAGQAMLAEALLAPVEEIPIVICPSTFGTGKTYLATGIGLYLTAEKNPRFDRIFVCPRDSKLGEEVGFVPGDEAEKTITKAKPILDNIRAYVKNKGDKMPNGRPMSNSDIAHKVENLIIRNFEFVPIISMGGRSISDSWIIYDEAQDMERFQINQLMKRIGENSKMVIIGDPKQVYNRHMNSHSNGLSYAANKMAGSPYAAVITMSKSEITRSKAAIEIARCLDN